MTREEAERRIFSLRAELEKYNDQYFSLSTPLISDMEFDFLMKELETLEGSYPEFFDENSPTQRVGNDINREFSQVEHRYPMLSLGNTYNEEELLDFDIRVQKIWNRPVNMFANLNMMVFRSVLPTKMVN